MNSVVRTIIDRRSERDGFGLSSVPRDALETIIRCGLAAPASKNAHPCGFHVVTDRSLLCALSEAVLASQGITEYVPWDPTTGRPRTEWSSTVVESAEILAKVPAAIFLENRGVFSRGRANLAAASPPAREASIVGYTLEVMGVGAALQNMWLAAEALGFAGVFMGDVLIAESEIKQHLRIGGDLVGVLALGEVASRRPPRGVSLDHETIQWFPESRDVS